MQNENRHRDLQDKTFLLWAFFVLLVTAPCSSQQSSQHGVKQMLAKAQTGDLESQYQLVRLYELGSSEAPKNPEKAIYWYRRSADKLYPKSENALGIAYLKGIGITKDDALGFEWLYKAALQGYPSAERNLAVAYHRGDGTPQNYSAAFSWFREAALHSDLASQAVLCSMYQRNKEVDADLAMAYVWCLIAQKSTNAEIDTVRKSLVRVEANLTPSQLSEGKDLAASWRTNHTKWRSHTCAFEVIPRIVTAYCTSNSKFNSRNDKERGPSDPKASLNDCESDHWVDSILNDGKAVKLDDGSIWRIDDADTVDTSLWLETDEVIVCKDKLYNTDDNTSVGAHRLHSQGG